MSYDSTSAARLEQGTLDAYAAFERGDFGASEAHCLEVLQHRPEDVRVLAVLGAAYHGSARYMDAVRVFERLVVLDVAEPSHWMNLGTARRLNKQYDAALVAYARAANLGAASPDFFYNVGLTHLDRFDYEAARVVLERAVELAPRDAEIRFEYARACFESLQADEAIEALKEWERLEGLNEDLIANIGQRLMDLGETASASSTVRRLTSMEHLSPRASLTLAQILERTNRVGEASTIVERLRRDPAAAQLGDELLLTDAQIAQREGRHAEALKAFESALAKEKEAHRRHVTLFALAKSLDALKRYDEAFARLVEAHSSQVEHFKLTAPMVALQGAPTMAITRHGCAAADVATWSTEGAPSIEASPIFIVAFPRSGTTLLELTLDAHPALRSMDEQPFLHRALEDLLATGHAYPSELGKVTAAELDLIRDRYWERVRTKVKLERGERLVDKNPLNLLRLPVIRRVFPHARIVLAIRHPYDVLLSCFMQHFRAPDFALLCTDLPTLGGAYRRSFDFWYSQVEVLRPAVREVRYETLVDRFEDEVRALVDFLEVPWHDAVLTPAARAHEKAYISTPSYAQVVQPINRKSVERWRNYARHFEPVAAIVEPYLDRWSYAG